MKLLLTTPESPCRTAPSPAPSPAAADLVLDGVRHQTWGSLNAQALAFANPDGSTALLVANPGSARRVVVDIGNGRVALDLPAEGYATLRG